MGRALTWCRLTKGMGCCGPRVVATGPSSIRWGRIVGVGPGNTAGSQRSITASLIRRLVLQTLAFQTGGKFISIQMKTSTSIFKSISIFNYFLIWYILSTELEHSYIQRVAHVAVAWNRSQSTVNLRMCPEQCALPTLHSVEIVNVQMSLVCCHQKSWDFLKPIKQDKKMGLSVIDIETLDGQSKYYHSCHKGWNWSVYILTDHRL